MFSSLGGCRNRIRFIAFLLLLSAATAADQLVFDDTAETLVRQSIAFPNGSHFTANNGVLDIDGRGQSCSVAFLQGCTLSRTKLRVHPGADLMIQDGWLTKCHIEVYPNAVVLIRNTALNDCEISHVGHVALVPTVKLTNCHLIRSHFLSPLNILGLQLQDCTVSEQKGVLDLQLGPKADRAARARDPLLRYTHFEACSLSPETLLAASHCAFKTCKLEGSEDPSPTPPSATTVGVPIHWEAGTPVELPKVDPSVEWLEVPDPTSTGRTYQVAAALETPEPPQDFSSFRKAPVPFAEFLPGSGLTTTNPNGTVLKRRQTHVNGLLVATLDGGKQAGAVTKMNLTATSGARHLGFSQNVGEEMSTALTEVRKFMQLRHGDLPDSLTLQIAFEEKYSGKDGPSAAVACGLLVESAFTGVELDSAFAVTGDMNADGSVQPIGGVAAKMRGATRGACKIIAIPSRNESAIADLIVREGPAPLAAINVFGISKFDEALALASTIREGPLQEALAEMEVIHQALKRDPSALIPILRTPQAAARLQSVLAKAPHCLSAKYLLLFSQGRQPKFLTLAGSIEAADTDAEGLVAAIDSDFGNAANSLRQDELGGSLNRLRNLRPRLDQRVWPYVDGLVLFGDTLRGVILNPIRSASRAQEVKTQVSQAAASANSAKKRLLTDPAVREELGL